MLNVVILSVVMLNVVTPHRKCYKIKLANLRLNNV